MNGACLCGRARIALSAPPAYINMCNCRFCRSTGAVWGYFQAGDVAIEGATGTYIREDLDDPWITVHFCPTCGTTTHYTDTPEHPSERIGVNMRLFAQDDLEGIETRYLEGRNVTDDGDTFVLTGRGQVGDGKAF